jgi:DNA repair protein RecN (Recombination protein N)
VQARFDRSPEIDALLTELDVVPNEQEDGLLLRRVVTSAGRSRAYIGASAVPLTTLKRLAGLLVDYASQHEHQVLLDEGRHFAILDRFGHLDGQRQALGDAVDTLRALVAQQRRLEGLEDDRRERQDYLAFQLDELDQAELVPDEEEALETDQRVLQDAVQLAGQAREAASALYSGAGAASERMSLALSRLRVLAAADPSLNALVIELEAALVTTEEAGRELGVFAERVREDPERLARAEDRLALLRRLARKHRTEIPGLIARRDRLRAEMEELSGLDGRLAGLAPAISKSQGRCAELAAELTAARRSAGDELARRVAAELSSLAMEAARLVVQLEPMGDAHEALSLGLSRGFVLRDGAERVVFHLSANLGEEPKALARVASGGELSRILLAIRRSLADRSTQVFVFDEIDAGIGGATAEVVGRKMAEIAAQGQVICITHLPQIAAYAAHHLRVEKQEAEGRTRTGIVALDATGRVIELVRMVAGTERTQAAEAFARELMERAQSARADSTCRTLA